MPPGGDSFPFSPLLRIENGPLAGVFSTGLMGESDKRFRLTLHYDGSAFHGWQIQPHDRTVQGALEEIVTRITGSRRPVEGSGRTDTGVHARGQVAAVAMPSSWTAPRLEKSLNALLPEDVWVQDVTEVSPDFHPRFDAIARTYHYRVGTEAQSRSPFERRWCWPLAEALDRGLLDACADQLGGVANFRSFAKAGQPERGYECDILEAFWSSWALGTRFTVTANRYLHHMVRYLVGTMVAVARGHRPLADFAGLLNNAPDLETSPPAPPQGLVLEHVRYAEAHESPGDHRAARPPADPDEHEGAGREGGESRTARTSRTPGTGRVRSTCVVLLGAVLASSACTVESIPRTEESPPTIVQRSTATPSRPVGDAGSRLGADRVSDQVQGSRTTAIVRAAQEVAPAVVSISVVRRQRTARRAFFDDYLLPYRETQGLGSGVIVNTGGTVLTNHHVIEGATQILVTLPDGRDFDAELVGTDPRTDVAVLSIRDARDLPAAPLGTASDLMIGEWTVAIGNPFGRLISNSEPTVTAGVISALGRHILPGGGEEGFYLGMIQTDASINPGNSGGPLVNALGEVIGINSSIFSRSGGSEGLGFAIPIDRAVRVAQDLIDHGEVQRAWIGIEVQEIEADAFGRSRGVRVARTSPGSPAAEAGIQAGARLLTASERRMATPLDYEAVMLDLRAGDRIQVGVEGMDPVILVAAPLPSASADRIELLDDLEVITVTPGVQAERRLASGAGALVVEISNALSRVTGLTQGDVILAVNNRQVRTAQEAADVLEATKRQGRQFILVFERGGRTIRTGLLEWR